MPPDPLPESSLSFNCGLFRTDTDHPSKLSIVFGQPPFWFRAQIIKVWIGRRFKGAPPIGAQMTLELDCGAVSPTVREIF
jgi:hypothetical protein